MDGLMQEVEEEMQVAQKKYGSPTSTHESYGVLAEEMSELLDAIRANASESVRYESIQVAAVAIRLADACRAERCTPFRHRSGFK